MKKNLSAAILCSIGLLALSPSAYGEENWQLYDDFNTGSFDDSKWSYGQYTTGQISVENGKAKIEFFGSASGESINLFLADAPATIKGVKATATVTSCTGDGRSRIGGYLAGQGENLVWSNLEIQAASNFISASVGIGNSFMRQVSHARDTCHKLVLRYDCVRSARMSRAARAGSAASMIGRPTTMRSAPAAIAAAGVSTRF